ncbi:MAG: metallopeptidase family protein [Pseudomonadota bacterium]
MTDDEFEAVVDDALERLPDWVRESFHNLSIQILDEADDELDPDGQGLLGLYVGSPLPERDANYAGELPDVIYLFRKPHLELGLDDTALRNEIATTLVHEIAHHFGIDDDHLHEIGWG